MFVVVTATVFLVAALVVCMRMGCTVCVFVRMIVVMCMVVTAAVILFTALVVCMRMSCTVCVFVGVVVLIHNVLS